MAITIQAFNNLSKLLAQGNLALDACTYKLALLANTYALNLADSQWSDISANEIAAGSGYSGGGETLAGISLAVAGGVTSIDADDTVFASLTATFRGAALYASGTFGGLTDPLVAYILFDDTPADTAVGGVDFIVTWPTNGFLSLG